MQLINRQLLCSMEHLSNEKKNDEDANAQSLVTTIILLCRVYILFQCFMSIEKIEHAHYVIVISCNIFSHY